jgi:hypothetical protein
MRVLALKNVLLSQPLFQTEQSGRWLRPLLWVVFGLGLLLQAFSPHLKVSNGKFIIPPALIREGRGIAPANIVKRERTLQWASGILTLGAALGLGFSYRRVLVRQFRHDS